MERTDKESGERTMQITMKRCAAAVLAAFALCFALVAPQQALADATDPNASIELKAVEGASNQVEVYVTTNQVDARTMTLALDIKTTTPGYVDAAFVWNEEALSNPDKPSLLRTTDAESTDGIRMNLYAGDMVGEPFKEPEARSASRTVKIGTVVLTLSSAAPQGEAITADVQVTPADGVLKFAEYRGAEVAIPASNLNVSDPVKADVVAAPVSSSSSASSSSSSAGAGNNSDILGETPATNVRSMPNTGDQMMPIVLTLVGVAVVAIAVIAVIVMRRKKEKQS